MKTDPEFCKPGAILWYPGRLSKKARQRVKKEFRFLSAAQNMRKKRAYSRRDIRTEKPTET